MSTVYAKFVALGAAIATFFLLLFKAQSVTLFKNLAQNENQNVCVIFQKKKNLIVSHCSC